MTDDRRFDNRREIGAATMGGASMIAVECRASHIERRIGSGYPDKALGIVDEARARDIGLDRPMVEG